MRGFRRGKVSIKKKLLGRPPAGGVYNKLVSRRSRLARGKTSLGGRILCSARFHPLFKIYPSGYRALPRPSGRRLRNRAPAGCGQVAGTPRRGGPARPGSGPREPLAQHRHLRAEAARPRIRVRARARGAVALPVAGGGGSARSFHTFYHVRGAAAAVSPRARRSPSSGEERRERRGAPRGRDPPHTRYCTHNSTGTTDTHNVSFWGPPFASDTFYGVGGAICAFPGCTQWKKQPTSSWVHQTWDQAEYVRSLNVDNLNGDVVSGRIAGLLRVLVAPAAPRFHLDLPFGGSCGAANLHSAPIPSFYLCCGACGAAVLQYCA
eukprot:gene8558-biopygen18136